MGASDMIEATDAGAKGLKTAFEREDVVLPYPTLTMLTDTAQQN